MKVLRSHTTPQFEKDFVNLPEKIKSKARRKIKIFEDDCFSRVLETHKLKGVLDNFGLFLSMMIIG